ncbi:hypothetical protein C8R45DRAFT_1100405 [Mycena sanguinolenta]|nr:hypothetical protein C8R45DRAFT_1100405 [Mycena sanguinolenta]
MHLGSRSAKETLKSWRPGLGAPSSVAVAAVRQRKQFALAGRQQQQDGNTRYTGTHESCVPLCMIAGVGAIAFGQAQTYTLRVGCNVAVDGDRRSSSLGTTGATALLSCVGAHADELQEQTASPPLDASLHTGSVTYSAGHALQSSRRWVSEAVKPAHQEMCWAADPPGVRLRPAEIQRREAHVRPWGRHVKMVQGRDYARCTTEAKHAASVTWRREGVQAAQIPMYSRE